MKIGDDYEVIEDASAPKGRRIVRKAEGQAVKEEITRDALAVARDSFEAIAGRKPDGRWSLARLNEELEALGHGS
jgi:hypothetical protein